MCQVAARTKDTLLRCCVSTICSVALEAIRSTHVVTKKSHVSEAGHTDPEGQLGAGHAKVWFHDGLYRIASGWQGEPGIEIGSSEREQASIWHLACF